MDEPVSEVAYCFGRFRVVPGRRLMLENGHPVRVGARGLDILVALAERGGETVSHRDLITRVWGKTAIDEVALRVHISGLRKVLGEGPPGLPIIANVQGRGYRLTLPILVEGPDAWRIRVPPHLSASAPHIIGRNGLIDTLSEKLLSSRFLTVVGPGGMGKTTLALALAEQVTDSFTDGVVLIDLAPLSAPSLLPAMVASTLELPETGSTANLVSALREKRLLLMFDNCEHLADAAAILAEALTKAVPSIAILATSREPLRADGEWIHRLPPLELPPDDGMVLTTADALRFSAIELFVERCRASVDTFALTDADVPAVINLCRQLDGIPLAIELAAASLRSIGLHALNTRLDEWFAHLRLGRRTADARHQTLSAMLDWSYDVLTEIEQIVLYRLAIFKTAISIEMAVEAAADEQITRFLVVKAVQNLHEKSLLAIEMAHGEVTYRLLQTTREYAFGKLEAAGAYPSMAQKHLFFLSRHFRKADEAWDATAPKVWRSIHGRYIDDIRAALAWAFSPSGDRQLGLELLAVSAYLWFEMSLVSEYHDRLEAALDHELSADTLPDIHMRLCIALGQAIWNSQGPTSRMLEMFQTGFSLAERTGSEVGRMRSISGLWNLRAITGDMAALTAFSEQIGKLYDQCTIPRFKLAYLRRLALTWHYLGDQVQAWSLHEKAVAFPALDLEQIRSDTQLDHRLRTITLQTRLQWLRGLQDTALAGIVEGVILARELEHKVSHAYFLGLAACPVALWCGDLARAETYIRELHELSTRYSLSYWLGWAQAYDAALALVCGKVTDMELPPMRQAGYSFHHLELFATLHPRMLAPDLAHSEQTRNIGWCHPEILRCAAQLRLQKGGEPAEAEGLLVNAMEIAKEQGALSWQLRSATQLARLHLDLGRRQDACAILEPAYRSFTEGFNRRDLVEAERLLSAL